MLILIVHTLLGQLLGGGERLVEKMGELLTAKGFKVAYVTLSHETGRRYRDFIGPVFSLKWGCYIPTILRTYIRMALTLFLTIRAVIAFSPDVIILSTDHQIGWILRRLTKRKVIVYVHWPEFLFRRRTDVLRRIYFALADYLEKLSLTSADAVLTNSLYTSKALSKVYSEVKSIVTYPGVDTEFFRPSKKSNKVILLVSRITPLKNIEFAINVHARVLSRVPEATLVIAGSMSQSDGPYLTRLIALAKSLGIAERVLFITNVSDDKLAELYGIASIFLYPRIGEHFGIALLEAISSGAVPMVSDSGGLREIVEATGSGIPLPPVEELWVDAITSLLSRSDDLASMSEAGREAVRRMFGWEGFAEKLVSVIRELR